MLPLLIEKSRASSRAGSRSCRKSASQLGANAETGALAAFGEKAPKQPSQLFRRHFGGVFAFSQLRAGGTATAAQLSDVGVAAGRDLILSLSLAPASEAAPPAHTPETTTAAASPLRVVICGNSRISLLWWKRRGRPGWSSAWANGSWLNGDG